MRAMTAKAMSPSARALCAGLREAQKAAGIGVRELARRLGVPHPTVSHWLNGKRIPDEVTIGRILGVLGVGNGDAQQLIDLRRNVTQSHWLTVGINGIPQQLAGVVECEQAASKITAWNPLLVPGLLQTSDYARLVKQAAEVPDSDIGLRLMINAGRREVLTRRRNPVEFHALIGEAAFLYEPLGAPDVMVDQLSHLVEMMNRPNVTVQVVSQRAPWHPGLAGPFILFEFPDAGPLVYFEHHSTGAFVPTEHDVEVYRKAIDSIRKVAKDAATSLDHISSIAHELEGIS